MFKHIHHNSIQPMFTRQLSRRASRRRLKTFAGSFGLFVCFLVASNILINAHWDNEKRRQILVEQPAYVDYALIERREVLSSIDTVNKYTKNENIVHVIMTVDMKSKAGLPVIISSVLRATNHTVMFHLGYCNEGDEQTLRDFLRCYNISKLDNDNLDFVFINFDKILDPTYQHYLSDTKNFTAFGDKTTCYDVLKIKAHKVFPKLEKAIHLSTDMLVMGDIYELWSNDFTDEEFVYYIRQANYPERFRTILKDSVEAYKLFQWRYNKSLEYNALVHSAGVSLLNLHQWKQKRSFIEAEINFWMKAAIKLNKKYSTSQNPWWLRGDHVLVQLALQNLTGVFDNPSWNVNGLGWADLDIVTPQKVARAKLLHWDGPRKPWISKNSIYKDFWRAQLPKKKKVPTATLR